MKMVAEKIKLNELKTMAENSFGNLVKAVVDIDQKIMVIDAELHADQETVLLDQGSKQENLWGINLYPDLPENEWIEFDSMINLRPNQNNRSRGVDDPEIQAQIIELVNNLVVR